MAELNLMLAKALENESWDPIRDISVNTLSQLLHRMVNSSSFQNVAQELFATHCPFVHVEAGVCLV